MDPSSEQRSEDSIAVELATVGRLLLRDVDRLVERLLEPSQRTPGYGFASAEDLRPFVGAGQRMLIQRALIEGSDLQAEDRDLAQRSTRQRMSSGYQAADILNSLSRSIESVWSSAGDVAAERECEPAVLARLGVHLMSLHRSLIDVMTTTIREIENQALDDGRSALVADVASLFAGRSASSPELVRALTPESDVQVVPIRLHGPEHVLSSYEARHTRDGSILAMCRSEGDLVALAFDSYPRTEGMLIGEGPRTGLSGLVHSCAQASRAVIIGRDLGLEGVVSIESLGARVAVVESPDLGARFHSGIIEKLGADAGRANALLTTVEAWIQNGMDVDKVAQQLSLHPNSVRYRLNRFTILTALSLSDVSDLVMIWWALEWQRHHSSGLAPL
ncbi:PucR family transcriptional regulator [Nocardioides seonyuensis]|uniref:PucR family transcriptional regulator n=1 Tax=Nocardioides seonyuensis TaxID=2518371 RepID=A0A4P7II57_9ACTN|nr:helix-turn-helix domain-containing protein [Nocardioides seonyuensis]QBX55907.1 PucR family transcriptional regulator [Nocardioides seonyuensis]